MTREWDIMPITIDAQQIGGKFKALLSMEEDR
jgi:hypothetical protein